MTLTGTAWGEQAPTSLRRRILFTVLLVLAFRLLADIPLLNVDEGRLHALLAQNPLLGSIDLFAGGDVLRHFSLVAAGLFPYLIALGVVTAASYFVPALRSLQRQGERGKKRLEWISLLVSIPLAFGLAWGLSHYLARQTGMFPGGIHWFTPASFFPSLLILGLVTLGSVLSAFITRLITKKGLGSGESTVLLVGASLGFVRQVRGVLPGPVGVVWAQRLAWIGLGGVAAILFGLVLTKTVRRIPVLIATRSPGGVASYVPLPLCRGGILPVSAAVGLLSLAQLAGAPAAVVSSEQGVYWLILAALIVLFTYVENFCALWQPVFGTDDRLAEYLRKRGNWIPGIRPGAQTDAYLCRVEARLTLPAALSLALLTAGVPYAVLRFAHLHVLVTALSVVVAVKAVEELRARIEADGLMAKYEGLLNFRRKRR